MYKRQNRLVARELLSGLGIRVSEAQNGVEALRVLQDQRFDVVLMDIQMPILDGVETTRRLRMDPAMKGLPIVALTAHAMVDDRQRFLDAGMDDYLTKPVEEAELVRVLSRWLPHAADVASASVQTRAPELQSCAPLPQIAGVDVAQALSRVNGKAPLLWRLLEEFRTRHAHSAQSLRGLIAAGHTQAALELAHAIKGAGATLGALACADAARQIELALRGERSVAEAAIAANSPALEVALHALEHSLAELNAASLPSAPAPDAGVPATRVPVSAAASAAALSKLQQALATNSFKAAAAFADWRGGLPQAFADKRLSLLAACIDGLDYSAALALVQQFHATPDHSEGSP